MVKFFVSHVLLPLISLRAFDLIALWFKDALKRKQKHTCYMLVFSKEPFHEFMDSLRHAYDVNVVKPHLFICAFSLFQGALEFLRFDRKPPVY